MTRRIPPAIWLALLFLLLGLPFLRKAGIHFDAAYELACFYSCSTPAFRPTIFGHPLPVMVIQYLGAFKAWLYYPILTWLEVTPVTLRLPTLLTGAVSTALSFAILDHIAGRRAAIAGSLLLATDAIFVIATAYDFGPVAFLHCFLLAGILLLLRFDRTRSPALLALAFFLFGLALWHKALFIWMLAGLGMASFAVIPGRIWALCSPARIAIASAALCVGALPVIYYNIATGGATLHTGNVMSGAAPLSQKVRILKRTLDGSVMFGWLTDEYDPGAATPPARLGARISIAVARVLGGVRSNWTFYAFLASCCLVPWLWFTPSRSAALFVFVYMLAVWGQMLAIPNTGATVHHAILLWPFPFFLLGIAGAELSRRLGARGAAAMAVVLLALVGRNLLLVNQYYADLTRTGTTVIWTDAIYPLLSYLDSLRNARVVTVDWGYASQLCLLSDGDLPRFDLSYALLQPSDTQASWVRSLAADPRNVFVAHTQAGEQFPGVRRRLDSIAAGAGYAERVERVITDRNGRPRFEIVRFERP